MTQHITECGSFLIGTKFSSWLWICDTAVLSVGASFYKLEHFEFGGCRRTRRKSLSRLIQLKLDFVVLVNMNNTNLLVVRVKYGLSLTEGTDSSMSG